MKPPVQLNFGERMREWRKARKEYIDKIKQKIKEKEEVDTNHPKLEIPSESKVVNLGPTQETEAKNISQGLIDKPCNRVEEAINHLRSKIL